MEIKKKLISTLLFILPTEYKSLLVKTYNKEENFLEENREEFLFNSLNRLTEETKEEAFGDYAIPCYIFAKELKKNPSEIAKTLLKQIKKRLNNDYKLKADINRIVTDFNVVGPYLNIIVNKEIYFQEILRLTILKRLNFKNKHNEKRKILIEYPSPNTNKSLHVGHIRNILLGNSLSNLLKRAGFQIIRTNLNNDRGIAVCKSMLGYELFYKDTTPEKLDLKPDHFVSKCYIKFESETKQDKRLNEKAQETLQKWENKDPSTLKLWNKILTWVYQGYEETYQKFKLKEFDREYYESKIYDKGKKIILDAVNNKIQGFQKEKDGTIICDLTDIGLDKKVLLRSDGTTIYITQDIYIAKLKKKEFNPERSIFIVAKEQEYHFKALFEILKRLKISTKPYENLHFGYGYVFNKEGKKFSSRKGEVINADWLYEQVLTKTLSTLKEKEKTKTLTEKEFINRAKKITYSVLSHTFLKPEPKDNLKFDIEKSLSFEGDTGPYILYTFARFCSILKKIDSNLFNIHKLNKKEFLIQNLEKITEKTKYNKNFNETEQKILKHLVKYEEIFLEATIKFKISLITNYSIKLAKLLNEYYQKEKISSELDNTSKNRKIIIILLSLTILQDALSIIDIEMITEM